ncbi:alpha/beta fold hydrolase [Rhodococcus sp. JVH1]|uniref:alpha/beta fold hydrolase n=1 Tax=Rhodococcus sp. JVH1 TaxID=745408 RepID=UPI000271EB3C|nr:alpha/beta hydrolase [Rhodococcus sp. JVH1]EJI93558.1 alpha/beta hydrolase fold family protein [Rhodococcus sp. JVH1]
MSTGTSRIEVEAGVSLSVQDLGSGRPIIALAGIGMCHDVFDGLVRRLAPSRRVVCVDLRGTGASDKPLEGYTIERHAADLGVVLDALDLRDADLLGWSYGGQVAFRIALDHPERLRRLVLVGSNAVSASRTENYPFGLPAQRVLPSMIEDEARDRIGARRRAIAAGFHVPPTTALLDWLAALSIQMPSWAAVASYESYLCTDLSPRVGELTVPVVQVVGADDPVHSAEGASWLQERLGSDLVTLPACGHYPMFEVPHRFEEAIDTVTSDG